MKIEVRVSFYPAAPMKGLEATGESQLPLEPSKLLQVILEGGGRREGKIAMSL